MQRSAMRAPARAGRPLTALGVVAGGRAAPPPPSFSLARGLVAVVARGRRPALQERGATVGRAAPFDGGPRSGPLPPQKATTTPSKPTTPPRERDEDERTTGANGNGNGNGVASSALSTLLPNGRVVKPDTASLAAAISAAAAEGADALAAEGRRAAAAAGNADAPATATIAALPHHRGPIRGPGHALDVMYRFSRPHTIIGTFLSVISISAMALPGSCLSWSPAAASAVAVALAAALCANVSIVGLNQLFDVEIDAINKPYLPLASGELTVAQGNWIVGLSGGAALALAAASGSPPLVATVAGSLLLGLVYSTELPFMRWKRSPVLAAACILAVRAVAVQGGFFLHTKHALATAAAAASAVGGAATAATATAAAATAAAATAATAAAVTAATGAPPASLASATAALLGGGGPPLAFAVAFMALFSVVIALFKDLPDVAGDKAAGITTFSVRFGTPRIFRACVGILATAYAGGCVFGLDMARRALLPLLASPGAGGNAAADPLSSLALAALPGALVAAGHALFGAWLVARSRTVDPSSPQSLARHYMWLWKLFYAEYLLLPLLR